jgi:hypothetical protein
MRSRLEVTIHDHVGDGLSATDSPEASSHFRVSLSSANAECGSLSLDDPR